MNSPSASRRVVITGMGVIAPSGTDLARFWNNVRSGTSATRLLTRFDPADMPAQVAAEVRDFDLPKYLPDQDALGMDLAAQYALAAAKLAVTDAALAFTKLDPDRSAVFQGISMDGLETALKGQMALLTKSYRLAEKIPLVRGYAQSGSALLAAELGIRGPVLTCSSSTTASSDAIGMGCQMLEQDEADVVVAGGAEAPLVPAFWAMLCLAGIMSQRNHEPASAMRPFNRDRDGFVLGEGAAFVVLEELSHALGRGAKIYAEVAGYGRSCDAGGPGRLDSQGIGLHRAMEKALRRAALHAGEIDYLNANGTAVAEEETAELAAIKTLFGARARQLAVSATKPATGHLLGAAGALETIICALALKHQEIPPTPNLSEPAPGCDLDFVPDRPRPYPIRTAMNLNSGIGGKNTCLVLRQYVARK